MTSTGISSAPQYYSEAAAAKPRLLLADDNPAMLNHVSGFLAKDFHIVATVTDGDAALRLYEESSPHLLVLDISMGKTGGLEVARTLRKKGCQTPIVFLTVHREADFVNAALAAGGTAYVVKSHMTNDLIPAIKAALGGEMFVSPCLVELP
jgi:DNA-binding NarL/FixJ family response regulator